MKRREEAYVGKRMIEMAIPGKRKRGRPRRRWKDLAREDKEQQRLDQRRETKLIATYEEDFCTVATSSRGKSKEEEEDNY